MPGAVRTRSSRRAGSQKSSSDEREDEDKSVKAEDDNGDEVTSNATSARTRRSTRQRKPTAKATNTSADAKIAARKSNQAAKTNRSDDESADDDRSNDGRESDDGEESLIDTKEEDGDSDSKVEGNSPIATASDSDDDKPISAGVQKQDLPKMSLRSRNNNLGEGGDNDGKSSTGRTRRIDGENDSSKDDDECDDVKSIDETTRKRLRGADTSALTVGKRNKSSSSDKNATGDESKGLPDKNDNAEMSTGGARKSERIKRKVRSDSEDVSRGDADSADAMSAQLTKQRSKGDSARENTVENDDLSDAQAKTGVDNEAEPPSEVAAPTESVDGTSRSNSMSMDDEDVTYVVDAEKKLTENDNINVLEEEISESSDQEVDNDLQGSTAKSLQAEDTEPSAPGTNDSFEQNDTTNFDSDSKTDGKKGIDTSNNDHPSSPCDEIQSYEIKSVRVTEDLDDEIGENIDDVEIESIDAPSTVAGEKHAINYDDATTPVESAVGEVATRAIENTESKDFVKPPTNVPQPETHDNVNANSTQLDEDISVENEEKLDDNESTSECKPDEKDEQLAAEGTDIEASNNALSVSQAKNQSSKCSPLDCKTDECEFTDQLRLKTDTKLDSMKDALDATNKIPMTTTNDFLSASVIEALGASGGDESESGRVTPSSKRRSKRDKDQTLLIADSSVDATNGPGIDNVGGEAIYKKEIKSPICTFDEEKDFNISLVTAPFKEKSAELDSLSTRDVETSPYSEKTQEASSAGIATAEGKQSVLHGEIASNSGGNSAKRIDKILVHSTQVDSAVEHDADATIQEKETVPDDMKKMPLHSGTDAEGLGQEDQVNSTVANAVHSDMNGDESSDTKLCSNTMAATENTTSSLDCKVGSQVVNNSDVATLEGPPEGASTERSVELIPTNSDDMISSDEKSDEKQIKDSINVGNVETENDESCEVVEESVAEKVAGKCDPDDSGPEDINVISLVNSSCFRDSSESDLISTSKDQHEMVNVETECKIAETRLTASPEVHRMETLHDGTSPGPGEAPDFAFSESAPVQSKQVDAESTMEAGVSPVRSTHDEPSEMIPPKSPGHFPEVEEGNAVNEVNEKASSLMLVVGSSAEKIQDAIRCHDEQILRERDNVDLRKEASTLYPQKQITSSLNEIDGGKETKNPPPAGDVTEEEKSITAKSAFDDEIGNELSTDERQVEQQYFPREILSGVEPRGPDVIQISQELETSIVKTEPRSMKEDKEVALADTPQSAKVFRSNVATTLWGSEKASAIDKMGSSFEEHTTSQKPMNLATSVRDLNSRGRGHEVLDRGSKRPRIPLDRIKLLLFAAGRRVHRGSGYEKLFSEYWESISNRINGNLSSLQMQQSRTVLNAFLKTKSLKKIHNKLILGLLARCIEPIAQVNDFANVIPDAWCSRIKIVKQPDNEVVASAAVIPVENICNEESEWPQYLKPLYHQVLRQKPQTPKHLPPRSTLRIPGAIIVDPLVRALAQRSGLAVSEDAVWLLVIAMKEYTQSLLRNSITFVKELDELQSPSSQSTTSIVSTKKRSASAREPAQVVKQRTSDDTSIITASHIHALTSQMPAGTTRSLSSRISRTTFERSLHAFEDVKFGPGQEEFNHLKHYMASAILAPASKRRKLEPPSSLDSARKESARLQPTKLEIVSDPDRPSSYDSFSAPSLELSSSPMVRVSSSKLLSSATPIVSKARAKGTLTESSDKSNPISPVESSAEQSGKPEATSLPAKPQSSSTAEEPSSTLTAPPEASSSVLIASVPKMPVRGGLGRGAKDLASLMARSKSSTGGGSSPSGLASPHRDQSPNPSTSQTSAVDLASSERSPKDQMASSSGNSQAEDTSSTADGNPGNAEKEPQTKSPPQRRGKGFGIKNLANMMAKSLSGKPEDKEDE